MSCCVSVFPLGTENNAIFPVIRDGRITSYPLTPAKEVKTLLFDAKTQLSG